MRYSKDLYKGTAAYYDRYRPPYPAALLDDLRARVPLDGSGRLLDLACGTGQIAFALAGDFDEVWAVDQEPEMIEFARRKANGLGVTSIRWVVAAAEDVALDGGFDHVTIGNAFHRLDRDAVAGRFISLIRPGGCVALLWSEPPWRGDRPWQGALNEMLERWRDRLGAGDRVPDGHEQAIERDPHEQVVRRAGFAYEGEFEFGVRERWTVQSLAGFVYSTSFLNRTVLAGQVNEFERDLGVQLQTTAADGFFEQDVTYAYELARRPPACS